MFVCLLMTIIKYIPLQQGLRLILILFTLNIRQIIKYIPLQQGLRQRCRERI